jgi:hypothetical protein
MEPMKTAQFYTYINIKHGSLDILGGIVTGYELKGRYSVPGWNKTF